MMLSRLQPSEAVSNRKGRLLALDGARGLSALFVACFHIDWNVWPARGYLAVDLFFLLSGYVIAGAYEERLSRGASVGWFFGVRMARLYPLYLFGTLLGLARYLVVDPPPGVVGALLKALVFLPSRLAGEHSAYPLDGAMWSLAAEVFVNLLYAWIGFRLSNRVLKWIVLVSGGLLTVLVVANGGGNVGSDYGPLQALSAAARVLFAFPLGVMILRLGRSGRLPKVGAPHLVFLSAAAAAYCAPLSPSPLANALIDLTLMLAALPLILAGLVSAEPPAGGVVGFYSWAGGLSYALYAVHPPIAGVVHAMLEARGGLVPGRALVLALPASVLAALFGHHLVEPYGRRWIGCLFATAGPSSLRTPAGRSPLQPIPPNRTGAAAEATGRERRLR